MTTTILDDIKSAEKAAATMIAAATEESEAQVRTLQLETEATIGVLSVELAEYVATEVAKFEQEVQKKYDSVAAEAVMQANQVKSRFVAKESEIITMIKEAITAKVN